MTDVPEWMLPDPPEPSEAAKENRMVGGREDREDDRDRARQVRWLAAGKTGWWWAASAQAQREVFGP